MLDGINTAKQWPKWPARIDGKISTRGRLYGGNWQVAVTELRLNGNIKQNKLTAQGSSNGNAAGQWHIPGINLALGRNQLDVKGDLDQQWKLDGVIDAPALNGDLPGLAGRVAGTVRLRESHRTAAIGGSQRHRAALAGVIHQSPDAGKRCALGCTGQWPNGVAR